MDRKVAKSIVGSVKVVNDAIGNIFHLLEDMSERELAKHFSRSLVRAVDELYSGIILNIVDEYPDLDPY